MPITFPAGSNQFGYVENYPSQDGSIAATNLTADAIYLSRVRVQKPITVSAMSCYIGASAGNIDMGIYTGTLTGGLTRVASCGSTAAAGSSALQTISLTASYTLVPGTDYWFAWGSTSGSTTLTVGRTAGAVALVLTSDALARTALKAGGWSTGLPSSLSSLSATSNTVWLQAA